MDKKHLFHTLTVICTWYTNNNWGFSSMQDYQRVFGSVWRRRRSADVSNAPKAQKLQDNFTQELRPPAAIINLYSCKGTRKHTTLKFGRNKNFCFCVFFFCQSHQPWRKLRLWVAPDLLEHLGTPRERVGWAPVEPGQGRRWSSKNSSTSMSWYQPQIITIYHHHHSTNCFMMI